MPCTTIHMLTAGKVLDRWRARPELAPFPVGSPLLRDAFLLGAMGPDMGFVPGVDRFFSELAHYVTTADLTRALLSRARTLRQEAFAWGWGTHHVTDVEIHPLVGKASGERLYGDRTLRLNSSDDLPTHVGIEVGLDLTFLKGSESIPVPPARPVFDGKEIEFLAGALEEVYGLSWSRGGLFSNFRTAVRRTAQWPLALNLIHRIRFARHGKESPGAIQSLGGRLLDLAGRLVGPQSAAAGVLRPLPPPGWMVEQVGAIADAFPGRFQRLVEGRFEALENRNMETGLPEDAPVDHPDSARTVERLRVLRNGGGGIAPV